MISLESFGLFFIAALIVIISPGPANLYVMARTVAQGMRGGTVASLGLALGSLAHIVAAALGLSVIFRYSPFLFSVLKIIGAGYLIWLGVTQILSARRPSDVEATVVPVEEKSEKKILVESALVEMFNPKVALFYLAFLPQFVNPESGPVGLQFVIFGSVFTFTAFFCDMAYALATARAAQVFRESRTVETIKNWLSGSILIGMGTWMAVNARE